MHKHHFKSKQTKGATNYRIGESADLVHSTDLDYGNDTPAEKGDAHCWKFAEELKNSELQKSEVFVRTGGLILAFFAFSSSVLQMIRDRPKGATK